MRDCGLTLTDNRYGKVRTDGPQRMEDATSGSLRVGAARQIRISVQVRPYMLQRITDPTGEPDIKRGVDIADKAVETLVASSVPLRNTSCEPTDGAE